MMEAVRKGSAPLPPGKTSLVSGSPGEDTRLSRNKKHHDEAGLVGFVNIGNSCYMNATLQALSNCPPFRQYFVDTTCFSSVTSTSQSAAAVLSILLKKVWSSDRHPGHLSPRSVSSAMKNTTFKGSQQQDAQEFLRCLLTQIHEEMGTRVPPPEEGGRGRGHRESMVSCDSDTSGDSQCSQTRLVGSVQNSPLNKKRSSSSSSLSRIKLPGSTHSSPAAQSKFSKYSKIITSSSAKSSVESIPAQVMRAGQGVRSVEEGVVEWEEGDVYLADFIDDKVTVHRNYLGSASSRGSSSSVSCDQESTCVDNPLPNGEESVDTVGGTTPLPPEENAEEVVPPEEKVGQDEVIHNTDAPPTAAVEATPSRNDSSLRKKADLHHNPRTTSIVSEVFEGILESRVKCLKCKKVSETREPFQDLSLPIPGRKEIAKFNSKLEGDEGGVDVGEGGDKEVSTTISRGLCSVWNYVSTLTRDLLVGPPTDLDNCVNAFFDTSDLKGDNRYYCTHCRSFQDSQKDTSIIMLPEVLCIHLKRFRYDAYISTNKISRHIRFPLTGLNMAPYLKQQDHAHTHLYDLNAVITHYGGAGAGHYVAYAKNSWRNSWYEFNDTRVYPVSADTVLSAEGYVLFYRRAAPNDSRVLSPLDLTSLLPRSGTTLPSPEVCYISRHWLHLLNHVSSPGSIFQYDFACRHGAVLPTLTMEDARAKALCIRREEWMKLYQVYGGGPLVPRLEICRECKELLSQLNERRKAEREEVHKVHSLEDKKKEFYLIFLPWVSQWQKFIHCNSLEWNPPVAIDNTPLLQYVGTEGKRTLTLAKGAPFRKVSQEVWHFFQRNYGGGPVIVTSLEPIQKLQRTAL